MVLIIIIVIPVGEGGRFYNISLCLRLIYCVKVVVHLFPSALSRSHVIISVE